MVVGGGIAGTAAALALHKAGVEVTVYEAYPWGGDDAGAFLTVGPNGMLALAQIDAAEAVVATGFPLTTMCLVDEDGAGIATVPLTRSPDGGFGHCHLRRADLYAILQEQARCRGVVLEHGKRLVGAARGSAGLQAQFADGTVAVGDLLIGADGLHSTVRTLIDPAAAPPRYVGLQVLWGYAPGAAPSARPGVLHMLRGRQARLGYMLSPGGQTWWFARVPGAELGRDVLASTTPAQWRERLVELFAVDHTPAAEIVAATGNDLIAGNIYDVPGLRLWHRDGMLVIGDAAHAASPAAGQGASMALEDAVMLARSLRDLPDREQAFVVYERLRRNRVDRIVAESAGMTRPAMPDPAQRARENRLAREQYARRPAAPPPWMFDYPLAWEVPVTPQLAAETAAAQRITPSAPEMSR
jgi:2-polyprenyl-6-methoxyphenol hydroxylase-like FAD-dependent oxidoreductase